MGSFAEKLRMTRASRQINQTELAKRVGITRRSLFAYENGTAMPRRRTLEKLAKELDVTVTYLTDPEIEDPHEGKVRDAYESAVHKEFGSGEVKKMDFHVNEAKKMFAGGDLSQEDKDAYFDILASAYYNAKLKAREKYGARPNKGKDKD